MIEVILNQNELMLLVLVFFGRYTGEKAKTCKNEKKERLCFHNKFFYGTKLETPNEQTEFPASI